MYKLRLAMKMKQKIPVTMIWPYLLTYTSVCVMLVSRFFVCECACVGSGVNGLLFITFNLAVNLFATT